MDLEGDNRLLAGWKIKQHNGLLGLLMKSTLHRLRKTNRRIILILLFRPLSSPHHNISQDSWLHLPHVVSDHCDWKGREHI